MGQQDGDDGLDPTMGLRVQAGAMVLDRQSFGSGRCVVSQRCFLRVTRKRHV